MLTLQERQRRISEGLRLYWKKRKEKEAMSEDAINLLTHKRDGTARHPSVAGVLKHFRYAHLPSHLAEISKPIADLAIQMADALPENPDLTCGLRDLLTAKDNFVRAKL